MDEDERVPLLDCVPQRRGILGVATFQVGAFLDPAADA